VTWTNVGDSPLTGPDFYGQSVAINGDGSKIIIGADKDNGGSSVEIKQLSAGTWNDLGSNLPLVGENFGDNVGRAVGMSSDGSRIIVGAIGFPSYGSNGHVHVYYFNGGTWTNYPITGATSGVGTGGVIL
jgi:hypothetical protein